MARLRQHTLGHRQNKNKKASCRKAHFHSSKDKVTKKQDMREAIALWVFFVFQH